VLRGSRHADAADLSAVAELAEDALEGWSGPWRDGREFVELVRRADRVRR